VCTLLFNVVLEVIERRANIYKQPAQSTTKKHNYYSHNADDIDIVGRSQSAVRDAYLALDIELAKVGLKINEQKNKYMIAARNDRTIRDVGQSLAIGDKHFEVMKGLRAELARNTKFANIVCSSGDLYWSLFVKKPLHLSDEVTINFEGSSPHKREE
jgi:hypothetical protein